MLGGDAADPPLEPAAAEEPLPVVPGPRARAWLAFEFVALVEYWLAPMFLGVTNYAGTWAAVGSVLFALFVSSLVVLVLLPMRPHLKRALRTRRDRAWFHGFWAGSFVAGLLVTNTFQLSAPTASSSALVLGATTVYTPFGAWPSLTLYFPGLGLFGTLNAEIATVLGLISVLASAVLRIRAERARAACPTAARPGPGWARRAAAVAVFSPFGLVTGCSACAPLYLAALGLVAPAAAAGGFSAVPLVPWIGLAGLLYLTSFGLSIHLLRRATEPEPPRPRVGEEVAVPG